MKKIKIAALMLLTTGSLFAQQGPLSSQYMFNQLLINPAIAGTTDKAEVRLINRNQWVGIDGAPVTQTASIHGALNIFNDVTGPISQSGIQTAYAYHFRVTEESNLSIGLQAGVFQYKINGAQLTTTQQNDLAIPKNVQSQIVPDAAFGIHYYNTKFYGGVAVQHLLGNQIKLSEVNTTNGSSLSRNINAIVGARYNLNEEITLEPSVFVRFTEGITPSVDLNAKLTFKQAFWFGASYRTQDAVVFLAGVTVFNKLHIGYAFDVTTSSLSAYSHGSHEIMVGYDFHLGKNANKGVKTGKSTDFL
jgi:type IX secretion system PorP/SprF family membrane protein